MKTKFMLSCIAVVAIATFVGTKALKTNAGEGNVLLLANVEAMSEPEWEDLDDCYFTVIGSSTPDMPKNLLECERGTSPNRITACPSNTTLLYESAVGKCRKS